VVPRAASRIDELGMLLVPRGGGEHIGDHVSFLDVLISMMKPGANLMLSTRLAAEPVG
jgi:hypothetical protein